MASNVVNAVIVNEGGGRPVAQGNAARADVVMGVPVGAAPPALGTGFSVHVEQAGSAAYCQLCTQPAQFVCTQCRKRVCQTHRRFWMNKVYCNECQERVVRGVAGGVWYCAVQ
mmetsp:Transcript_17606/g.46457  ORF Transcript_17606/g.46457 Transcript_17606/m.46457 type:complete len:113 (+) Transcript_17606:89-427(+)